MQFGVFPSRTPTSYALALGLWSLLAESNCPCANAPQVLDLLSPSSAAVDIQEDPVTSEVVMKGAVVRRCASSEEVCPHPFYHSYHSRSRRRHRWRPTAVAEAAFGPLWHAQGRGFLRLGEERRITCNQRMNATSSRSHALLSVQARSSHNPFSFRSHNPFSFRSHNPFSFPLFIIHF